MRSSRIRMNFFCLIICFVEYVLTVIVLCQGSAMISHLFLSVLIRLLLRCSSIVVGARITHSTLKFSQLMIQRIPKASCLQLHTNLVSSPYIVRRKDILIHSCWLVLWVMRCLFIFIFARTKSKTFLMNVHSYVTVLYSYNDLQFVCGNPCYHC